MPPLPNLPSVSSGNLALDLSGAASSLAQGLQAEKAKRREDAMAEAMLRLKQQQAEQGGRATPITISTPQGLRRGLQHQTGEITLSTMDGQEVSAPEYGFVSTGQDASGNLTQLLNPKVIRPGAGPTATQITLPPGQTPRDVRPSPVYYESPAGPALGAFDPRKNVIKPTVIQDEPGQAPRPVQPKGSESDIKRARDAFEMIQGRNELTRVATTNPGAYNQAAAFMATRNFLDAVPVIGDALDQIVASAQNALGPDAAIYVRAFTQLAGAKAFSRGGATLTANEIKWAMDAIAPRMYADPRTKAAVDRMIQTTIMGNITGNPAWIRYKDIAKELGFDSDMQSVVAPEPVRSKYDYTR